MQLRFSPACVCCCNIYADGKQELNQGPISMRLEVARLTVSFPLPHCSYGHPYVVQTLVALLGFRLQEQLICVTQFRNCRVGSGNLNQMYTLQRQIFRKRWRFWGSACSRAVHAGGTAPPNGLQMEAAKALEQESAKASKQVFTLPRKCRSCFV